MILDPPITADEAYKRAKDAVSDAQRAHWENYAEEILDGDVILPDRMRELVGIYWQTSRKYRSLIRIPIGMTGREAMRAHRENYPGHADRLEHYVAAKFAVCNQACCHPLTLTLTPVAFDLWRKAGGECWPDRVAASLPARPDPFWLPVAPPWPRDRVYHHT